MISFLDLVGKCFTILLLRKKPTICLNQPHTNPSLQSTSFCCLIARSPGGRDSHHVVVGDLIQAAFHNPVSSRQLMLSRTFGSLTLQLERLPQRPAPWNSQETSPWVTIVDLSRGERVARATLKNPFSKLLSAIRMLMSVPHICPASFWFLSYRSFECQVLPHDWQL